MEIYEEGTKLLLLWLVVEMPLLFCWRRGYQSLSSSLRPVGLCRGHSYQDKWGYQHLRKNCQENYKLLSIILYPRSIVLLP